MDYRLVVARSEGRGAIGRKKKGVFIKENLRDPCAHGNDGNVLYLDCISINILVVILTIVL